MTNIRRLMVGVAVATAVLAGCDPYSKASTAPPAIVAVTATAGAGGDSTTGTQTAGAWTIDGALTSCTPGAGVSVEQPIIFVTFNKQMNPSTVQSSVTDCTPTKNWLTVQMKNAAGAVVQPPTGTAWYSCYDPSSPTAAEGGSAIIFLGNAPSVLSLQSNPSTASAACKDAVPAESGWASAQAIDADAAGIVSTHITGSVSDKEGRSLPIDVTVNYAPNPAAVRNLTVSATTANSVTLSWTDRPCADATQAPSIKNLIQSTDASGNTVTLATENFVAATNAPHSVTITPADPAKPASYDLVAETTVGTTTFDQAQASLTNVVPGLPTLPTPTLALTAGNVPVVVTTGAIPAEIDDIDVYRASYSSEASTTVGAFSRLGNVGAGHTSFTDVSSAANGRYVYVIVPIKSIAGKRARGADSAFASTDAIVTPPKAPGAGTPTVVTDTSVTVEWPFISGTITTANSTLTVERAADNAGQPAATWTTVATKAPGSTTPAVPAGSITLDSDNSVIDATDPTVLTPATVYWYRLVVGPTAGGSANGTPVSVTTLALAAPTNVAGTRSSSGVSVTWTGSTGATGYIVERSLTAACGYASITTTPVAGSPYVDATAPANVAYKVVAVGAGGKTSAESAASPVVP